uniref:Right handed beta helix domain-containing protein n=1 Tax=Amphimedon queenslandica TaxID=400682 RepID=A0A1X7UJR0_AMPQE
MLDTFNVSSPLQFNRTVFQNTVLYQPHAEPSIVNIYFNNSVFTNTTTTTVGSCIHAINTETLERVLNIHLNNITAYNNFRTKNHFGSTRTEIVKVDYAQLYTSEFNNFSYNFGTVFSILNSIISLNGQLDIIGNNGYIGTGFKVQGSSYFLLSNGLNATFINNTALTIGGAIYAVVDDANGCMFQSNTNKNTNIKMTFIDNTASEAGSSIYSNKIHGCEIYISGKHRNISIPPTSLCLCDLSCNRNATTNEYNLSAFIRP